MNNIPRPIIPKKSKDLPVRDDGRVRQWWEGHAPVHPMTDTEFADAYVEHVFLTATHDPDLRRTREKAFWFVRKFMMRDFDKELAAYREAMGNNHEV